MDLGELKLSKFIPIKRQHNLLWHYFIPKSLQQPTRIKVQPYFLYDKCIISHICPMPRSRPTTQFSFWNAHKGTQSHPTTELAYDIYIAPLLLR